MSNFILFVFIRDSTFKKKKGGWIIELGLGLPPVGVICVGVRVSITVGVRVIS